jgi:hypothetical protein
MNEIMNLGIENKDGILVVSSRIIANGLGKEHRNVVRDLENILKTMAIKGMLNSEHTPTIIESTYINEQNY